MSAFPRENLEGARATRKETQRGATLRAEDAARLRAEAGASSSDVCPPAGVQTAQLHVRNRRPADGGSRV